MISSSITVPASMSGSISTKRYRRSAPWQLGTVSPVPTYPCQRWADQTTGLMKKRNTANTAWLVDGKLDTATGGGVPVGGAAGAILVKNSASDGDMVWSTASYFPASGGTLSGSLVIAGNLGVNGSSTFNNPVQVNSTLVSSVNIQCNVGAGQNAHYWSNVAGVRQCVRRDDISNGVATTLPSRRPARVRLPTVDTARQRRRRSGQRLRHRRPANGCEINGAGRLSLPGTIARPLPARGHGIWGTNASGDLFHRRHNGRRYARLSDRHGRRLSSSVQASA